MVHTCVCRSCSTQSRVVLPVSRSSLLGLVNRDLCNHLKALDLQYCDDATDTNNFHLMSVSGGTVADRNYHFLITLVTVGVFPHFCSCCLFCFSPLGVILRIPDVGRQGTAVSTLPNFPLSPITRCHGTVPICPGAPIIC